MNRKIIAWLNWSLLITSLWSNLTFAQLDFKKLSDSSYIFTTYQTFQGTRFSAHGLIKITAKHIVLIDTPWDTTQFQPLLDSIQLKFNKPVAMVISTHWHEDRTAGLSFYANKGISTYSSKATYNLCIENKQPTAQNTFVNDTVFKIDNTTFETFYPGAGHTSDNIVVYFPVEKILIGGCFVKSVEADDLGNLSDANIGMWPFAIRTLIKKYPNVNWVIPGHQKIVKGTKALKHTRKLADDKLKGRKKEKSRLKKNS